MEAYQSAQQDIEKASRSKQDWERLKVEAAKEIQKLEEEVIDKDQVSVVDD